LLVNVHILELDVVVDDLVEVEEVDSLDDLEEDEFDEGDLSEGGGVLEDILKEVTLFNVLVHDTPNVLSLCVLVQDVDEAEDVGVGWQPPEGGSIHP
jgi:hypothetical protein